MRSLHPYIVYDRVAGSEEGALLVFAHTGREARKLAWPEVRSWFDTQWIDLAVRRLKGDATHLRRSFEPHVIEDPPACDRCEHWFVTPLNADGLCEDCALDAAEQAREEAEYECAQREVGE